MAKAINIIQRQEKVKKLMIRGLTYKEMARTLNTTEKTAYRDARKVREKIILEIKKEPVENAVVQMHLEANAIIREAWKMYHNEKAQDKTKLSCLRMVMDANKGNLELLQNLGILRHVPDILMDNLPNTPELSRIHYTYAMMDVKEEDYWKMNPSAEVLEEARKLAKKDTSKHSEGQKIKDAIGVIYQKRKAKGFV